MPIMTHDGNSSPPPPLSENLGVSDEGWSFWDILAISQFWLGIGSAVLFACPFDQGWFTRFSLLFIIASGAWMSGSLLGFIFGVPRFKSEAPASSDANPTIVQRAAAFTPSTNLEQISDWLTKIIVGATLVQLQAISNSFTGLCTYIGDVGKQPELAIYAGGMIIFQFSAGFLWCYLWCSIRIFLRMVRVISAIRGRQVAADA
jgi:hypothetical protein